MTKKIRALVVDDSALARQVIADGLSGDPEIEVVGVAVDPYEARDLILQLRPDVMTLDVQMPKMDGVEFLRRLMPQRPTPVVMVSSCTRKGQQTTLDALAAGAVDYVAKPSSATGRGIAAMVHELRAKVKAAASANVSHLRVDPAELRKVLAPDARALPHAAERVVAIGASTGGTEALRVVLASFPVSMAPVLIVQHMPQGFTAAFAQRLDDELELTVREAVNGDRLVPGTVLIAPGSRQMSVAQVGPEVLVKCETGARVSGHCPSVDVLMRSVAGTLGSRALGVLLTGMGRDGAQGMVAIRAAGGRTVAQDEATSVVFGMPKQAHDAGGVEKLVPLEEIGSIVVELLRRDPL